MPVSSVQYGQQPWFYANGLQITNDATTPNTLLDIGTGSILDSTGNFQLELTTALKVNTATLGFGGIDTGTVAASTVYAVYVVFDPVDANLPGAMISLSYTGPLMPFGYSAYALIGFVTTDASVNILKGYWTGGNTASRLFFYDAPQATAVTAGHGTTPTLVDITKWVPKFNNKPTWISTSYVPATAGNTLKMQPSAGTGFPVTVTGQVATVAVTTNSLLMSSLVSGVQGINYELANGSDAVAVNVAGYQFFI